VRVSARLLFFALVLAELAHTSVAIFQHRIPSGHDGFQYFTLQYYFLNNAIQSGEVAQWIPYMNHGTVATLWYGIQGSFLQNVLLYVAPLVRHVDLLTVFHLGLFVDEMILLTGTWLLARRFFRTPAVFFIAASVVGSCVWLDQPYWNFRLYYALPLVLEMGHRFLATGRWRWFFLTANLLALQTIGNLPYFIPIQSFAVVAYFVAYAAANHGLVWPQVRALRWRWPAALAVVLGVSSFIAAYAFLTFGTDQLLNYNAGRAQNGTTDLAGFLTYGGATDLHKWVDVVLNLSPWFDITLYAGILFAPLVLCGLVVADPRRLHLVLLAATMLLFTLGTFVSVAAYYAWPGMHYFRHIGLVSPLVKVLCCFVAGIGFEWLFDPAAPPRPWAVRTAAVAGALVLVAAAALAITIARSGPAIGGYVDRLSDPGVDRPMHTYDPGIVARRLRASAALALVGAAVVGVVPFWLGAAGMVGRPRTRLTIVAAVLAFVAADVYRFKFAYLVDRSDVIPAAARSVTHAVPFVYPPVRDRTLLHAATTNPRLRATLAFNQVVRAQLQGHVARGARYWSNGAFLFTDEAGSSFRVDSWLKPLDQFMRMYWGDPINDISITPRGIGFERFDFPLDHAAAAAAAGVSAEKIRFFAQAYGVPSENALVPLMTDASYTGNLLFVLPAAASGRTEEVGTPTEPWLGQQPLSTDDSRQFPYEVRRFDANHLAVKVTNASSNALWMSYADVWHPLWRATVNGRPVPVYRAQMAYTAVPLDPGENLVEFDYGSVRFSMLTIIFAVNAACWLVGVGYLMGRIEK
jgi:hypothetical protein